jgi:uracil-DNA glycosylase
MTDTQINLEEIKEKLIKKFEGTGWDIKLRSFIKSDDFSKIINSLYNEREDGKRFTPPLKYVFRAFEECPLDKLKVVIVGQDVYPHLGVADGIAFSCSLTGKAQPSLKNILKEVNKTVYKDEIISEDVDLKRWANQGVLMLNTALTCQIDKVGSHYDIWKDFVAYVIDMLNLTNSGIIFILLGAKAQELESLIGDNHYVLKATHPASAVYTGGTWDCNDVFNKANDIIEKSNGKDFKIQW